TKQVDGTDSRGLPSAFAPRVKISLAIRSPAANFIRLDPSISKLAEFTDDKGTDLAAQTKSAVAVGFAHSPKVSDDRKTCFADVVTCHMPAKDSSKLKLSGAARIWIGVNPKEDKQSGLALKDGSVLKAGKVEFTLEKVGKPTWGADPLNVTLK